MHQSHDEFACTEFASSQYKFNEFFCHKLFVSGTKNSFIQGDWALQYNITQETQMIVIMIKILNPIPVISLRTKLKYLVK